MKKLLSILLTLTCLAACTAAPADDPTDDTTTSNDTTAAEDTTADTAAADALRTAFLEKADDVIITDTAVTVVDASGKEVTVSKNPASVINLYASFTTLWYEAGGEVIGCIGGSSSVSLYEEYIGRDITADEGMTVVATSSAGKKWDVETIIALQPELIICSTAMSGYKTIESPAAAANIPLLAVEYNDFSDYLKWFKVFCNVSGHADLWDSVAMPALDSVVDVLLTCPTEDTPHVFSMFASGDSLQANTSGTVVGGMITAMNAQNIVDGWGDTTGAERLDINLETVFAADPDVILIQCHAAAEDAQALVESVYGENPVWQSLSAVKAGRVYYLEKSLFHNKPNSRFAEAYATMAAYLYPDMAK